MIEQLDL